MNLGPETFEGRVVLVTGTASGIGLATVAMLLDAGARVHAADFRAPLAKERLGAERLASGRVSVHQLDVTDPDAVEETIGRIGEEAPIDALVCCAGTNVPNRRMEQLTDANWRLLLETNLTGVFSCLSGSHAPAAAHPRACRSRLERLGSLARRLGPRLPGVQGRCPRFGTRRRAEEHDGGVRFTSILPAMVATELMDKRPEPPSPEVREKSLQPEDVAATIVFSLSLPARACVAELTVVPNELQVLGRTN